jgi:hypothetical protein
MMSVLIPILFSAAVCLALVTIAATWSAYGPSALMLRQETADVWRPGFRPLAAQIQTRRPHYRSALRAAA